MDTFAPVVSQVAGHFSRCGVSDVYVCSFANAARICEDQIILLTIAHDICTLCLYTLWKNCYDCDVMYIIILYL